MKRKFCHLGDDAISSIESQPLKGTNDPSSGLKNKPSKKPF
jgi:hypothetical protein